MRVLIISAAILSLIAGVATTARAQTVKQFQLVGFTAAAQPADTGFIGLTAACQVEFEASRMCNSVEVMQTVDMPVLQESTTAWVTPIAQPGSDSWIIIDASGVVSQAHYTLSCRGWSSSELSAEGLTVDEKGWFYRTTNCTATLPVACCSLIAVPEPSTSLLQGAAAATLGTLAAKRIPRATSDTEPP